MGIDDGGVVSRCVRGFAARYGGPPELGALAPGRVNLIGDHTDYNEGFVLPMAIDRYTAIVAARRADRQVLAGTALSGDVVRLDGQPGEPAWACYVRGTLELCSQHGLDTGGLMLWIESDVPAGGGLSSSAALCVGVATLVELACGRGLGVIEKARLCQRVEQEYAGVPCGIMDQASIAGAHPGSAMLLDCRSLVSEPVPIDGSAVRVLIAHTGVSRTLAGSVYAQRRRACEEAAARLGVAWLRDVAQPPTGQDLAMRCARHVVTENVRVRRFVEALRLGDWKLAGDLMNASHGSLRDDYEITGPALDTMVDCARRIEGVLGARMTGAGMGGCAAVLVRSDAAETAASELARRYQERTGNTGSVFAVRPVGGAAGFSLNP